MKKLTESQIKQQLINNDLSIEQALTALAKIGLCPNLLNDDNRHWAIMFDGVQTIPVDENPDDIMTSFYVEKHCWKKTIREALIYSLNEDD